MHFAPSGNFVSHKLCSNDITNVCNLLNFKKLAISSVVGTGNRNFNPILVITTLWTLLSPTIVRMQAVLRQYTFCCLSSAALPSQIPHEDNRCARNTQQCAGRSTFCAFFGDSGGVRKPLMWEKTLV